MNIGEIIRADFRNILRDPTLLAAAAAPFLILMVVLLGVPWITSFIMERWGADITPYHRVIQLLFTLIMTLVYGIISAFIILEERDESILSYIKVTPFSMRGYLIYRIGFAYFSTLAAVLLLAGALTLTGDFSAFELIYLVTIVPIESIILTLVVVSFADNKVEGLAIAKMIGLIPLTAVAAFYVTSIWKYFMLIFPPVWITMTVEAGTLGERCFYLIGSVLVHLFYIAVLIKYFRKRIIV